MLYSLIIKARDEQAARIEAAARGIRLVGVFRINEIWIRGHANVSIQALQHWFAEDLGVEAPFAHGALLFFSELSPSGIPYLLDRIDAASPV